MKSNRLPCEIYSRGYVQQARYYELQLLWEYTWVPQTKVEPRSQISQCRVKHLNVIDLGRQDSETEYCGVQAGRVWEISKNTNIVLGKGVTPRSQVKMQVKTSIS